MDNKSLIKLNTFINKAYECFTFQNFLKFTIFKFHELVLYDSGLFFCAISNDSSFFKPYIEGNIENYYDKQPFPGRNTYLQEEELVYKNDPLVFKSTAYSKGLIDIPYEPRKEFLKSQKNFHIACIRIINKGQFLGEIYLHREKNKNDFSDEEMFILQLLQPHLSTIFSIIHTMNSVQFFENRDNLKNRKGMCILDKDLSLISGNVTGIEMLKYTTIFGSSVLYHVKEFCSNLIHEWNSKNKNTAILNSLNLKLTDSELLIDIFMKKNSLNTINSFVITLDSTTSDCVINDYKYKFTSRELDIIDAIIQGKNNNGMSESLNISENTVKTHIKNIYKKTGANNRAELTYILMLNNNS